MPAALSIVIPTSGRRASLQRVLAALDGQTERDFEVVLVADSRAGDVPGATVRADAPGASGARNAGWRAAQAPVVLFLDDDIIPAPSLVAAHLEHHRADPSPQRGVLGHVRWADEIALTPLMAWLDEGVQFDYGSIRGAEADWYHLYSCNVSLKRSLLERVGGFDAEAFPFGYEDLDLGFRLNEEGLRLAYDRAADAEHLNEPTLDEWLERVKRIAASERAFITRYPQFPPYFHERFEPIAASPPPRGLFAPLSRVLPRGFPVVGPRAWASAQAVAQWRIARAYEDAWAALPA